MLAVTSYLEKMSPVVPYWTFGHRWWRNSRESNLGSLSGEVSGHSDALKALFCKYTGSVLYLNFHAVMAQNLQHPANLLMMSLYNLAFLKALKGKKQIESSSYT